MTKEEAEAIQAQVEAERQKIVPYEGLPSQTVLLSLDTALEYLAKLYVDDGVTPMMLRQAYGKVHKELQAVRNRLLQVDNINVQRQVPCYTIEDGKLVRVKLDVLLQKLQEVEGVIL